jgi:hypothetical protein
MAGMDGGNENCTKPRDCFNESCSTATPLRKTSGDGTLALNYPSSTQNFAPCMESLDTGSQAGLAAETEHRAYSDAYANDCLEHMVSLCKGANSQSDNNVSIFLEKMANGSMQQRSN